VRSKLADVLWRARSRKGKALVVIGGTLILFFAIGIAFPPEDVDEPAADAVEEAQASPEPTTTEAEAETTTEESPEQPPPSPPRVARIIDGDTLDLRNGDTVRLVQIDAPETNGECYASKSTKELRRLLPRGAEVRLESDQRLDNRDRYGRLLATSSGKDRTSTWPWSSAAQRACGSSRGIAGATGEC